MKSSPSTEKTAIVADLEAVRNAIQRYQPSVIVNAAAYTAVDRAETEYDQALLVNATAPGVMAREAARLNVRLIHYSTDYVFDGEAAEPYTERESPNPRSAYGKTKLEGEQRVAESGASYLILRTSWLAGAHGGNFAKTILRLARERDSLRIVSDQIGAPTTAALLADVTARILGRVGRSTDVATHGIYHIASSGSASWYDYASYIVVWCRDHDVPLRTLPGAIEPITTAQYPFARAAPQEFTSGYEKSPDRVRFGVAAVAAKHRSLTRANCLES